MAGHHQVQQHDFGPPIERQFQPRGRIGGGQDGQAVASKSVANQLQALGSSSIASSVTPGLSGSLMGILLWVTI